MIKKYCKVIKAHISSFTDPLNLKKGEKLLVENIPCEWPGWIWCTNQSRQSGWVPKNFLEIHGNKAVMLRDYNATELTASIGERFLIEQEESGWVWVISTNGKSGWIPIENIEICG